MIAVRWELSRYRQGLLDRGVELDHAKLAPKWLSPEENAGAQLTRNAWRLTISLPQSQDWFVIPMKCVKPGIARAAWKEEPVDTDARHRISWNDIEKLLAQNGNTLDEIQRALALSGFNLHLDYSRKSFMPAPQLQQLRNVGFWLSMQTLADLRAGRAEQALDHARLLPRLVFLMQQEPLPTAQSTAASLTDAALGVVWEALQAPGWSDEQLSRLQSAWEPLDYVAALMRAMNMERATGCASFALLRHSTAELDQFLNLFTPMPTGSGPNQGTTGTVMDDLGMVGNRFGTWMESSALNTVMAIRSAGWQYQWSHTDELHYLKLVDLYQNILSRRKQGVSWKPLLENHNRDLENTHRSSPVNFLCLFYSEMTHDSYSWVLRRTAYAETARQLALTAIALERYRLRHDQPPASLKDLVPRFLAREPIDPMNGKPLVYRPKPGGAFTLYSVGDDGIDNGGSAKKINLRLVPSTLRNGIDWVWPQPATTNDLNAAED